MSRQNKVNPGMYTQRGRLTQDDAARELARQRSIGSQQVWQHDSKNAMPWPTAKEAPSAAVPDAGQGEAQVTKPSKPVKTTTKKVARVTAAKPKAKSRRKAVLARNAAGPAAKPRQSAKRRKS